MIEQLLECLPQTFAFYHLGQVELSHEPARAFSLASSDQVAITYSFQGDARGVLALIFDQGLNPSVYAEMGNVIASQMSTRMSEQHGLDIAISPPHVIPSAQLSALADSNLARVKTYHHRHQNQVISLQAIVISSEASGNA